MPVRWVAAYVTVKTYKKRELGDRQLDHWGQQQQANKLITADMRVPILFKHQSRIGLSNYPRRIRKLGVIS